MLGFFRRRKAEPQRASPQPAALDDAPRGIAFEALTEEWRLRGRMHGEGRLSDLLNHREPIRITDVEWAPTEGASFEPAPGLQTVDPYDIIVVITDESSLPPQTEEERQALRVHKMRYDVRLEAPPFSVTGTVHLYRGTDPRRLLERGTEMFMPVTDATVYRDDRVLSDVRHQTVLLNRTYLRDVAQLDPLARG